MKKKIIGIKRRENYSPNHITNDALILSSTGEVLKEFGYEVEYYDESFIEENEINEDVIFSMVRGYTGLSKMAELENRNRLIINSPKSAFNCYRESMLQLLYAAEVPVPQSKIIPVDIGVTNYFEEFRSDKIWLKRGDIHAEHKEDVTCVKNMDELQNILSDFNKRKIKKAVVQEHLEGDVVKFYSVKGSSFFHWYYTNGGERVKFDEKKLKEYASLSAETLGLDVYGGDAVISPDGFISIIDVNDWPSFAPVRDEAATAIAGSIHKKIIERKLPVEKVLKRI